MKYALVFVLIGLVFWVWRSQRLVRKKKSAEEVDSKSANHSRALAPSTEIVACAVCNVHLPRPEAITGTHGLYCSVAHKQQAHD